MNLDTLALLRAAVPALKCKGLCQGTCGPIGMSKAEAADLQANGHSLPGYHGDTLTCTLLDKDGRCSAYEHRPMVCRLYGAVKALRCEHGCVPDRWLSDEDGRRLLQLANRLPPGPGPVFSQEQR